MSMQPINLATIANGAATTIFWEELSKVLENVANPNTDPKAARSITLTFTVKPSEDRSMGTVTVKGHSKVAALKPIAATLFFPLNRDGQIVAVEDNPAQRAIEFSAAEKADNEARGVLLHPGAQGAK